jgi:hypothetical protein
MPAQAIIYPPIMSDEKIQLPDFLIADLFKGSLVDLETSKFTIPSPTLEQQVEPEEAATFSKKIKFLGENEKRIIIIVDEPEAVFLLENDLAFLINILKACKLDLTDIAIVNTSTEQIDYEMIKEQLKAETIILFNVEPSAIKLPFMIPTFQIQKYADCTFMVAPPLYLLNKTGEDGKLLKTKLWMSLKKVFNIA